MKEVVKIIALMYVSKICLKLVNAMPEPSFFFQNIIFLLAPVVMFAMILVISWNDGIEEELDLEEPETAADNLPALREGNQLQKDTNKAPDGSRPQIIVINHNYYVMADKSPNKDVIEAQGVFLEDLGELGA